MPIGVPAWAARRSSYAKGFARVCRASDVCQAISNKRLNYKIYAYGQEYADDQFDEVIAAIHKADIVVMGLLIREWLGEDVVFALDEALMCQGNFGGRSEESIIWIYGSDAAARFNGVAILGSNVSHYSVMEKHGLKFTDLNRTLADALANEHILVMQGITEAVSKYYYTNGESFNGLSVAPEYQDRFEVLAGDAIDYYDA